MLTTILGIDESARSCARTPARKKALDFSYPLPGPQPSGRAIFSDFADKKASFVCRNEKHQTNCKSNETQSCHDTDTVLYVLQ